MSKAYQEESKEETNEEKTENNLQLTKFECSSQSCQLDNCTYSKLYSCECSNCSKLENDKNPCNLFCEDCFKHFHRKKYNVNRKMSSIIKHSKDKILVIDFANDASKAISTIVKAYSNNKKELHAKTAAYGIGTGALTGLPVVGALLGGQGAVAAITNGLGQFGLAGIGAAGSIVVSVLFFGYDMYCLQKKWNAGEITAEEWWRLAKYSSVKNGTMGGTAAVVGSAGAIIGTVICPGPGTILGGAIGAFIGAIIGGIGGICAANKFFGKKSDEQIKQELLNDAIKQFQFEKAELDKPDIFTLKLIKQKYRARSKECHPDRLGGSDKKFYALNLAYTILIIEWETRYGDKKEIDKKNKNLAKIIKQLRESEKNKKDENENDEKKLDI